MKRNKLFTFGLMLLCSIGFSSAADQTVSAGSNTSAIQTAINTAGSGSTVRMEVGRYFLDTQLTIPTGVTVIGGFKGGFADANRIYPGAATTIDDMTVLDGNSLVRTKPADKHRVATVQGTLDGVLVRNGHVRNDHGGGLKIDGGTVQNCIIKGNVAMHVPSSGDFFTANAALGGGVYIESGKLINSVVAYNMSNQGHGVAGANGKVINCTVTANTYAPVPVEVKTGTFHHFKHWRNTATLPWGDSGVFAYNDGKDHSTPDMGVSPADGTGTDSEFDPGEITLSTFYLAQTEVTTSQYAVFANAIDLTLNGSSVSFATTYLSDASSGSIPNISSLIDPSPDGLNGATGANSPAPVSSGATVGVRYGFSADGVLFSVNNGGYHGLRKVGSDYVYYKSLTSGQINLHVSNESMSYVSWYGSLAFSLWIGGTLPTEAQWEFAARRTSTGVSNAQYSGSDILNDVGWYSGNNIPADNVHEVGTKAANEIGLYDMSGNQWEWCADWINNATGNGDAARVFYPNYNKGYATPTLSTVLDANIVLNPVWNLATISSRVYRGGNWSSTAGYLSLAFRTGTAPANVGYTVSFRPALAP